MLRMYCNYVICPMTDDLDMTPLQNHGVQIGLGTGPVAPSIGGTFTAALTPTGNSRDLRCVRRLEASDARNPFDVPIVFYEELR